MPGFALDSGGIDATAAAAEVLGDSAWGTVLALPFCAGSSVSSTIPFMILEVDATFNFEHFSGLDDSFEVRTSVVRGICRGLCSKRYIRRVRRIVGPDRLSPAQKRAREQRNNYQEITLTMCCKYLIRMPRRGLEPPRCYPLVPETSASTNSATWAVNRKQGRRRNVRMELRAVN